MSTLLTTTGSVKATESSNIVMRARLLAYSTAFCTLKSQQQGTPKMRLQPHQQLRTGGVTPSRLECAAVISNCHHHQERREKNTPIQYTLPVTE